LRDGVPGNAAAEAERSLKQRRRPVQVLLRRHLTLLARATGDLVDE